MVTRSVKLLIEVLGTLVAGLAILVALAAWSLSAGPISLDFLTPYIEQALSTSEGGVKLKLDRTVLAWGGWRRTLDLRALGVHAFDAAGRPLLTLPEISVSLSARALFYGVIAPTSLDITGARVHLRRDASGKLDLELGDEMTAEGVPNVLPLVMQDLLRQPDPAQPVSFLRRISITGADLAVDDSRSDTSWKAELARLTFERDAAGIRADAALDIHVESSISHIEANGVYDAASRKVRLEVAFDGLTPALFAHAASELTSLGRLALPIGGNIAAAFALDGALDELRFDVQSGGGRIALPELYPEGVEVRSFAAKGALADGGRKLELEEVAIDLGGPTFMLTGTASGLDGDSTLALEVSGRDVKVDELDKRWPAGLAPNARHWVTSNLSNGTVEEVYASVVAHGKRLDPASLSVERLTGTMRLSDVDVRYLGKMPKVRGVGGNAQFDTKSFNITLDKGALKSLELDGATVAITGLDGNDERIAIEVVLHGPLSSAVQLVDSDPLNYATALGIDPKAVGGDSAIRLALNFPLLHDLRFAQVQVSAAANMKDVAVASALFGHDLSRGNLVLKVNKEGMEVTGEGSLGPAPISLDWRETFGKAPQRLVRLKGEIDDAARKAFDLDTGETVGGPVAIELALKTTDRRNAEIELALDLGKATLALPPVDWRKAPGIPGKAHLTLLMSGDKLRAIRGLSIEAADLVARGQASFDPESGAFRSLGLEQLAFGRDRLVGELKHRPDGVYEIRVKGDAFDASPFLKAKKAPAAKESAPPPAPHGPRIAIALAVKKLWLAASVPVSLSDASGTIELDGGRVTRAVLDAKTPSGAAAALQIVPAGGKRTVNVRSEDAGDMLRALDVIDNVVGGRLKITGAYDDAKPDSPLAGTFQMVDYKLSNAPVVAKILTLASLTGIVDRLSGEGVSFGSLVAPFVKTGGRIELEDGRTAGSEIGVTFEGWLDSDANQINMNGTIVPVYTLNSLLGNLPVVGQILVGPKGGGIFAATFQASGKLDSPDVTVNPLSALAPGIIRELFNALGSGGAIDSSSPAPEPRPDLGAQ